jgi:hypothetical protein
MMLAGGALLMSAEAASRSGRSLSNFILLEFALSIPFWGIGAMAQAHIIPDQVLLRAAWSLTPMMAASILAYQVGTHNLDLLTSSVRPGGFRAQRPRP